MANFGPEISPAIVAACQAGAAEASQALSQALDAAVEIQGAVASSWAPAVAAELDGPGLVILWVVGDQGGLALLPASSGLLPAWHAQPDAAGASKLATLAQQLGKLLLPAEFKPGAFSALHVSNLATAINRGGVATGAGRVTLPLAAGDRQGTLTLLWPAPSPARVFEDEPFGAVANVEQEKRPAQTAKVETAARQPQSIDATARETHEPEANEYSLDSLPNYSRSLLRIEVPVMVTLASKKQPLGAIVELVPGAIIQFNKSCDEMLELEVSGRAIAQGECVKVGDKFGLRITALILPEERFQSVPARIA